jgi:DedD protein
MTSALQNRLVGTIIVVALVIILVPEFLDGEKRVNPQEFVDVPPMAELVQVQNTQAFDTSEVESQLAQAVEVVDEMPLDANAPADKFSTPGVQNSALANVQDNADSLNLVTDNSTKSQSINQVSAPAKELAAPAEDISQLDIKDSGWVVQLGSFKHQKNVKELLRTLNAAGYRAYSRPVMTSVGELTKVFVGPELDKETLQLALPHLREITKLKGKITPFEVSAG